MDDVRATTIMMGRVLNGHMSFQSLSLSLKNTRVNLQMELDHSRGVHGAIERTTQVGLGDGCGAETDAMDHGR